MDMIEKKCAICSHVFSGSLLQCPKCGSGVFEPQKKQSQIHAQEIEPLSHDVIHSDHFASPETKPKRGWLSRVFGDRNKERKSVGKTGTCDLCNGQINYGDGYVFYSDTMQPRSTGKGDIGSMYFCDVCTNKYINEKQFKKDVKIMSMTTEEFSKNVTEGIKFVQEAHALGVIRICKAHGFTAAQARSKGREFAKILWEDKERCISESTEFWKSTLGSDPPYNLVNCIEIISAFYVQQNTNMVVGPVSGIMFRKALVSDVTCIDCKKTFEFSDGIDIQKNVMKLTCPLCKAVFSKSNIRNSES